MRCRPFMVRSILASASAACFAVTAVAAAETGGSFFESFDRFDPDRWELSHGWTNGDHQICHWHRDNAAVAGGAATLTLSREGEGWRCAEFQTRQSYGYGTYEVRMSGARGSGVISAFFTYTGPVRNDPHDEVDFEILGKNTRQMFLNAYTNGQAGRDRTVPLGFDSAETTADYAFEWVPGRIRWFINGRQVHELDTSGGPLPTHPGKIYLSIWNARGLDAWAGAFRDPGQPLRMTVHHVAFTRMGDPCQHPDSLVCRRGTAAR